MFEGAIYNNKANKNVVSPLGCPWQYFLSQISMINMEILLFMFEGPVSNNKGNIMFDHRPGIPFFLLYIYIYIFFFNFFINMKILLYFCFEVLSLIVKTEKQFCPWEWEAP